ncbi:unnamed protein product [Staurois parvus]|uniref:Uncharacterized protein n=1 Tax=Staurois parvus TaxID=386267 RepID=A0ABN9GB70_9NEOB|nr:unnamed protein product [Staurois parvus]
MAECGDGDSSNGRPYSTLCQKIQHTSSVRRPESGTWQSVAMETAAMGGRTGTHERLWTWQQHEEAVYRGPWQIRGLAAAMGGP